MIIYRNISKMDESTLRNLCKGLGVSDSEMYTFYRAYSMLQLKHWIDGYRYFREDRDYRKICMKSFIRNVESMLYYKRGCL